jgi:hypothetical protein
MSNKLMIKISLTLNMWVSRVPKTRLLSSPLMLRLVMAKLRSMLSKRARSKIILMVMH